MRIIWDETNTAHIARHKVTPELAEKIIEAGLPSLASIQAKIRYVIEATIGDKHYRLVFDSMDDGCSIYPVTAFPIRNRKT
jgi:hypothetical protein